MAFALCAQQLLDELQREREGEEQISRLIFASLRIRTVRPTRLLCRFMSVRPSRSSSRASMNFLAYLMPNSTSAEQPPHLKFSVSVSAGAAAGL